MIDLVLFSLLAGIITAAYLFRSTQNKKLKNLPPSPLAFPVIGHLHLLKQPKHRSLRDISQNLGGGRDVDVFSLRLGSRDVVVVTSASAAEEFLTHRNDIVFANRIIGTLGKYVAYNNTVVSTASYGEYWRKLRRICTAEIFSVARLKESSEIRRDEVRSLLKTIHVAASKGQSMIMRPLLSGLTLNIIMKMVAGKRYYGEKENDEAKKVLELISVAFKLAGFTYIGDFFPFLKMFDFDGYIKKAKRLGSKMDEFLQKLVDEHRRNRGKEKKTMISHLLSLQEHEPENYTDEIIKGLVLVMLFAGTDTTSVTLEWAMANLLNHPEVLKKLKKELNDVVSKEGRLINETDLDTCTYLDNVISETLRLYPAAPLLIPHVASDNCNVAGYDIPRGTWLFINTWAIQRDPDVWNEPEMFKPERFESETTAHRGGKFLPFGMGRRACPGMGLAHLVLGLALGSLIQCFDWEKEDDDVEVDMSEGKGLTMPKDVPLVAKCMVSPILDKIVLKFFY